MDDRLIERAHAVTPGAVALLRELVRIPADHVHADAACGLSNHEGPRLEYLKEAVVRLGAVASPEDVTVDGFGNVVWTVSNPDDGVPPDDKTVVFLDGHTDTVKALRDRWIEAIGGGIDAYDGLVDTKRVDEAFLTRELGYLPPREEWDHLVWGRGSADQLGGVVCQVFATKLLLELRDAGALDGIVVTSLATVAEEDNDGGGPMYVMRRALENAPAGRLPDVFILTEGTGSSSEGALGIYRGQRGRMQIQVTVTGKSCHGSMPHEGRNPLEAGGAILAEAAAAAAKPDAFGTDDFLGAGTRTASDASLDTPSDCAVPERFRFRFDRRLTAGEDPRAAVAQIESLASVRAARDKGFTVDVSVPEYAQPTWRGTVPGNAQIYPGWVTPPDHPAIESAVDAYRRVVTPQVPADGSAGARRKEPRVSRWVFSTDGVGVPLRRDALPFALPPSKRWIGDATFTHPAMFGFGPGIEHNTHKIGECVDARELPAVIALLARFPSLYRARTHP